MDPDNPGPMDPNTIDYYVQVLGFANLIQQEARKREGQFETALPPKIPKESPKNRVIDNSQIRCICGDDKFYISRPMIECTYCHLYLHIDCAHKICPESGNFLCPFCRVNQYGIDPFTQLVRYTKKVNKEIKIMRIALEQAKIIENDYFSSKTSNDPNIKKKYRKYKKALSIINSHFQQLSEIQINAEGFPKKSIKHKNETTDKKT